MPIAFTRPPLRVALLALSLTSPLVQAQADKTALPIEAMQSMASAFGLIRTDYVTAVDGDRLMAGCTKGMFKQLDAASVYLDVEALRSLRNERNADVSGIGVELVLRAGLPTVASLGEGSPAEKAGLRPRDYILDIDGTSMEETELPVALAKLSGKAGSEVVLTIRRPGESAPRALKLVRETVRPQPVAGRRGPGDIGYLHVRGVREGTPAEVRAAFRALQQAGRLRGLVLDLRQSPGGLLNASIEVAAMFLPAQAVVVRTEGRVPEANQTYTADRAEVQRASRGPREDWPEAMTTLPLAVLVDGGTASGAEIIAAALRDNGRARLVGSKTFGRGSIQTVRVLSPTSAVKLTTALFRTPGGQTLQDRGLLPDDTVPDLETLELAGGDNDPALKKARALLAARGG